MVSAFIVNKKTKQQLVYNESQVPIYFSATYKLPTHLINRFRHLCIKAITRDPRYSYILSPHSSHDPHRPSLLPLPFSYLKRSSPVKTPPKSALQTPHPLRRPTSSTVCLSSARRLSPQRAANGAPVPRPNCTPPSTVSGERQYTAPVGAHCCTLARRNHPRQKRITHPPKLPRQSRRRLQCHPREFTEKFRCPVGIALPAAPLAPRAHPAAPPRSQKNKPNLFNLVLARPAELASDDPPPCDPPSGEGLTEVRFHGGGLSRLVIPRVESPAKDGHARSVTAPSPEGYDRDRCHRHRRRSPAPINPRYCRASPGLSSGRRRLAVHVPGVPGPPFGKGDSLGQD